MTDPVDACVGPTSRSAGADGVGASMPVSESVDVMSSHALRAEFQPVVDLATQGTFGFEAIVRGPGGESPRVLCASAGDEVLEQLERMARFAAMFALAGDDLDTGLQLFLRAGSCGEADHFRSEATFLDEMVPGTQIVLEMSERTAAREVDDACEVAQVARSRGWLVALEFGRAAFSAELLEQLRPEFVKLDLRVVRYRSALTMAPMLSAVRRYLEASGATLIAEGIENLAGLQAAHAVGASGGQGRLLGEPAAVPTRTRCGTRSAGTRPPPLAGRAGRDYLNGSGAPPAPRRNPGCRP